MNDSERIIVKTLAPVFPDAVKIKAFMDSGEYNDESYENVHVAYAVGIGSDGSEIEHTCSAEEWVERLGRLDYLRGTDDEPDYDDDDFYEDPARWNYNPPPSVLVLDVKEASQL